MKLNELKPAPGSKKSRRRAGRGIGSGKGKTAGRGQKGQKSRSGFSQAPGWEGGRSSLVMRLPKRGFNRVKEPVQLVNLRDLNGFAEGDSIDAEKLTAAGIVLAAVFAVLGLLPLITLGQVGIVVGLGILLDTFLVRTLVVPALFDLLGDRMWWPSKPPNERADADSRETVDA